MLMSTVSYGSCVSAETSYLDCAVSGRQEATEEQKRFIFEKESVLLKIEKENEALSISISGSVNYAFSLKIFELGDKTNTQGDNVTFTSNSSDKYRYQLLRRSENKSLQFSRITSVVLDRATGEVDFYEITADFDPNKVIDRKFAGRCIKSAAPRLQH